MALKFLNKKGWHTGSLGNVENVWKAEQKHEAEQRKLEELRKQIQEERERSEFRQLQEQAGLIPSGWKGSSEGFKALQPQPQPPPAAPAAEASTSKAAVPGALFEDKPQSANDAWRKLHSDPLLLIRQREQVLARIKNNPIKMAMIKKSVEAEKKQKHEKEEKQENEKHRHHYSKSKNEKHSSKVHSDSEDTSEVEEERRKRDRATSGRQEHSKSNHEMRSSRICSDSVDSSKGEVERRSKRDQSTSEDHRHGNSKHDKHTEKVHSDLKNTSDGVEKRNRHRSTSEHHQHSYSKHEKHSSRGRSDSKYQSEKESKKSNVSKSEDLHHSLDLGIGSKQKEINTQNLQQEPGYKRHQGVLMMSEEERAARLREMQLNAELHEEQRGKRLKRAAEADAQEALRASTSRGKNFLDAAQKSIYGTEKGGSSTIEESVRRRAYYSQGGSAVHESNAFRR
ncbi:pre-mRNA-splicing factor CWC25 homolog isoform X2 [Phoenix dactylifera]|uniref:Pre-mRNA-splicing factor CWC25 homolog isoform X2 n=1 Tax=Phoenix dactylifera TaxID=42345 RepID=A0A8B8ZMG4_PHODC|nr:pre-mRNA-splicing factor CWC25 homolog isoform X2 [Phoenix dactylifera]